MNWRRLRTLLQREARATYRDRFTMAILVAVPLVALLVFGFILSTAVKDLRLGVHDACGTSASRRLVSELAAQGAFAPVPFATRDALDRALVSGRITAAVVIPPDFDRAFRDAALAGPGASPATRAAAAQVEVIYDGAEAVLAANAEGYLRALVSATVAQIAGVAGGGATGGVRVVSRALFNPTLDGTRFMVAGTFGFVLSFLTTLITAVSIVNERLQGTFEQLQVTPATSFEILLGKILPLGAVFAADVVLMMLVAGALMGVWPAGSALFFIAISAFYVLTSLAMGIIISATSATAAEAVQKTVLFSIPLVQLSGFAFPTRNMPDVVRYLAEVFPATHYIRISRAVYLRGEGPATLLPELAALFVFAALLIAVALRAMESRA
jgi:ABC-2 type transport system permease protein